MEQEARFNLTFVSRKMFNSVVLTRAHFNFKT